MPCTAGNINQLVLAMDSYLGTLKRTRGIIAEFVNPKYKDASKTAFKSATRLECMMQDYPKEVGTDAKVGFTVINQVCKRLSCQAGSSVCAAAAAVHSAAPPLCMHSGQQLPSSMVGSSSVPSICSYREALRSGQTRA